MRVPGWERVAPHVHGWRAAAVLAAVSLVVFAVQALAWPVQRGRDAWDYLVFYLSLTDGSTPFPLVMLMRSPVTALVLGVPMQLGGASALEVVSGVLYATMIVAWVAVALTFSRGAAVVTALVLLVTTPYALPFHEPSSDMVVATGLALFALGVARTWRAPSTWRFVALGGGVAALTLSRPSYQVLIVAVVLPLATLASWRARTVGAGAFLAGALVPLAVWAAHNGIRYDDFTVSRSGSLNVPFYPAFLAGEIRPDAGPASRRLATLVEREVLTLPPYRRLGVSTDTYFRSGKNFEVVRLAGLVDRVDGLGSDYALLRAAAREVDGDGDLLVRGVNVSRSFGYLRGWLGGLPPFEFRTKPDQWPTPAATIDVGGRPFPNPETLPPSPDAVPYGFLQCASDEIRRCALARPEAVFTEAALARRYAEVAQRVAEWDEGLGARAPRSGLASRLDAVRRVLPPSWLWIAIALGALVVRRPRAWFPLALIGSLALLVLAVHALGGRNDPFYALPVLPALPVVAIAALAAPRRGARESLA